VAEAAHWLHLPRAHLQHQTIEFNTLGHETNLRRSFFDGVIALELVKQEYGQHADIAKKVVRYYRGGITGEGFPGGCEAWGAVA